MDKVNRSHRIRSLLRYIPEPLQPEVSMFFGEHVIRVNGQLCLVVTLDGDLGIRATRPELEAELLAYCGNHHWSAHGRIYEQWYLLPAHTDLNQEPVIRWIGAAAQGAQTLQVKKPSGVSA